MPVGKTNGQTPALREQNKMLQGYLRSPMANFMTFTYVIINVLWVLPCGTTAALFGVWNDWLTVLCLYISTFSNGSSGTWLVPNNNPDHGLRP